MFSKFFFKQHSARTLEVVRAAFPTELENDIRIVMSRIGVTDSEPHDNSTRFHAAGQELNIPSRVYFPEVGLTARLQLTETQHAILAAILTRHHSGYQRERWARELAAFPTPWTTPFMALLLEDYVCEVHGAMEESMTGDWVPLFRQFADNNPEWKNIFNQRIVNYWSVYYRYRYPKITGYPGYRLTVRLGLWDTKTCPKLLARCRRMENKR